MTTKSPLGLKPKRIHELDRLNEIRFAIERYSKAKKLIPIEWVNEMNDLMSPFLTVKMWVNKDEPDVEPLEKEETSLEKITLAYSRCGINFNLREQDSGSTHLYLGKQPIGEFMEFDASGNIASY